MKSDKTKERIMLITTEMLRESPNAADKISIRSIAERAEISVGLINHHFISKENLIEQCVQRIIDDVVHSFTPDIKNLPPIDAVEKAAKQVMSFLMKNDSISRISILGDMKNPQADDNSMGTAAGFAYIISGGTSDADSVQKALLLVGAMQSAFLRKEILHEKFGIDLYDEKQRDSYIEYLINKIVR